MHAAKTNEPAMQYSTMSVEDVTSLRKVHQLKAEGLNQKQIAEKMEISKQTVHDLWHRKLDVRRSSPGEQGVSAS